MTTAERAAAPFLQNLPVRRSDGPGQFAFADPHRIHTVLKESGWAENGLNPYLSRLGHVGLALQEADDGTRTQVVETVRSAYNPYVHTSEVRFTAACWMVGARASSITIRT